MRLFIGLFVIFIGEIFIHLLNQLLIRMLIGVDSTVNSVVYWDIRLAVNSAIDSTIYSGVDSAVNSDVSSGIHSVIRNL